MSFAKIHQSIYDGTLAENWQALVTFQQFLVLADSEGHVDMTLKAIHQRTGIPLAVLLAGIEVLTAPDPLSRTPDNEGKRLVLIDDHRQWGWRVVNYKAYRESKALTSAERQRRFRERKALAHKAHSPPDTVTKTVTKSNDVTAVTLRNEIPSVSESESLSDSSPKGECEGIRRPLPNPNIPSLQEVLNKASFIGLAPWKAEDWWNEMEGCGWLDHKSRPIAKWEPVLARVKSKWEADGRPKGPPVNTSKGNVRTDNTVFDQSLSDLLR